MSFHRFFGRQVDCTYHIRVSIHQMTSKWPLNDLKWPIRTWKHNFLTKSHFGACNMSFHRFFGRRVDCAYQIWVSSHKMTSKWPPNDLKWPIVTCNYNFLTQSHFGAWYMSFHRFFNAESIVPIIFEFRVTKWPPNDLKWPILTWKHNFLTKSHFEACNMSFHKFLWTPSRFRLSYLSFESPNDLQMT